MLTMLLGVGGGFILVPAMIYLLGMATQVVVGTSLFQTLFVTAAATMVHALTTKAVDIVLAGLLLLGSVAGAQVGARLATKAKPEYLRLALAVMVLLVAVRIAARARLAARRDLLGRAVVRRAAALLLLAPLLLGAGQAGAGPRRVAARYRDRLFVHRRRPAAVRRDPLSRRARCPMASSPTDVVVVVKGPAQSILVREKEKVAGIWVNAERTRYRSAPSFYAIASSRPIAEIVDERTRAIYELGLDSLQLSPASRRARRRSGPFRRAGWSTCAARSGLYYEDADAVEITDGVLYRARVDIPARVPVGRFTAETFLIRDGRVLAAAVRDIDIRKSGFERFVARAADRSSLALRAGRGRAVGALGWGAGAIARRI